MPRCADAAGGGQAPGLHDAGVEGRLQVRDDARRPTGTGRGDCRFAGLERDRRSVGSGAQGMKKYVWSETRVEGGQPFTGTLAHPPSNTGAFQNLAIRRPARAAGGLAADSAVLCGRRGGCVPSAGERRAARIAAPEDHRQRRQRLTSPMLSDGDLEKATSFPFRPPARAPGSSTNFRSRRRFAPSPS